MKKLALLFFIAPIFSFAQQNKLEDAIAALKPDSGATRVLLPDISEIDWYKMEVTGVLAPHKDVVTTDTLYYKIFSNYPKDSLPSFDFTKQELVVRFICRQCLISCPRVNGHIEPCHRNACAYSALWYVREKKVKPAGS